MLEENTNHPKFLHSSEKLPEVLNMESLPPAHNEGPSSAEGKDIAFSPPVYPAGILLVCNNCAAYRKLLEAQTPSVRKWALRRQNEPLEVRLQRLERERTAKKSRRDKETPEEREVRRMRGLLLLCWEQITGCGFCFPKSKGRQQTGNT